jgi:hypothetical protein
MDRRNTQRRATVTENKAENNIMNFMAEQEDDFDDFEIKRSATIDKIPE